VTTPADLRPLHRRPRPVALVALGGAVGTAVRALAADLLPAAGGWPWATWAVNVTGALLLGVLLEHLARTGPDDGRLRDVRLLLGTGALGGYTTYSTLALETVGLASDGAPWRAVLYAATTVLVGLGAAAGGMALGARLRRRPGAETAGRHAHPSGRIP
jgi:fluoride exporter